MTLTEINDEINRRLKNLRGNREVIGELNNKPIGDFIEKQIDFFESIQRYLEAYKEGKECRRPAWGPGDVDTASGAFADYEKDPSYHEMGH